MQQASPGFIDALRWGSTIIAAQVTLHYNGQPTSVVLPVSDASFTIDRNSEFRRSGSITIEVLPTVPPVMAEVGGQERVLLPLQPTSILAPFGTEVSIALSAVISGEAGTNGWVNLGLYEIATSTVADTGVDLTTTLTVYDRSWAVAQRTLRYAYTIPAANGDLQSELEALLKTAWGSTPPWTYNIVPNPQYQVPAGTYNQGQDPWQAALDIFTAAGYELFFDVNGNVVGKPIPNPIYQPVVWNFTETELSALGTSAHPISATPYTTPVDVTLTMTRDGISNDFIVVASGANNAVGGATPVQAAAADTNPNSPTYINGPMGNVPSFIYDSLISSLAQAQAEANYDLATALAQSWVVSVDAPPNPLFDIDDVCTITRARLLLDNTRFVVDTVNTSIRYDAVTTVGGRFVPL